MAIKLTKTMGSREGKIAILYLQCMQFFHQSLSFQKGIYREVPFASRTDKIRCTVFIHMQPSELPILQESVFRLPQNQFSLGKFRSVPRFCSVQLRQVQVSYSVLLSPSQVSSGQFLSSAQFSLCKFRSVPRFCSVQLRQVQVSSSVLLSVLVSQDQISSGQFLSSAQFCSVHLR